MAAVLSGSPWDNTTPLNGAKLLRFALHPRWWFALFSNRWFCLAAASWVEACSGVSYMFGLYSQSFKETLGYNQQILDMVGMAKDIGGNVGIVSGFVGDIAPTWVVLTIGAVLNVIGYGFLWLVLTGRLGGAWQPPVWVVMAFICVGTNGATFFNTAGLVTCVKNFPHSRGPVVGLLKGFIGLSGALFTQFYLALYAPNRDAFLLMAAWLPSLVAVLATPAIHQLPPASEPTERANLMAVLAAGVGLALYLLAASLLDHSVHVTWHVSALISLGALAILAWPARIAVSQELVAEQQRTVHSARLAAGEAVEEGNGSQGMAHGEGGNVRAGGPEAAQASRSGSEVRLSGKGAGQEGSDRRAVVRQRVMGERHTQDEEERQSLVGSGSSGVRTAAAPHAAPLKARESEAWSEQHDPSSDHSGAATAFPQVGDDHTLWQAVQTVPFWLIYAAMTLASGSGLTAINNLGQVGRSLGYEQQAVGIFVSLMSIWNFLGRVGAGYISEHFLHERAVPRPAFMAGTQLAMAAGHLLFASALPGSLYVGSAIVGLAYGSQWGLMPAVASEVFGLRHFGTLYNWLTITNPTGSYLLSVCIAGYLYDYEAEHEAASSPPFPVGPAPAPAPASGGPALMCHGAHCFRVTFLVMAAACVVASCLSLVLVGLTRSVYLAEYTRCLSMEEPAPPGVHDASCSSSKQPVERTGEVKPQVSQY
ncbi:unnamed protein product [Closterium sp. Yama58-4]|nr:unnamed protein product [Closterium sp. Yama58-4]